MVISDPAVNESNLGTLTASFFDHKFPLVMRDGQIWIDRPFIQVGKDLPQRVKAPNIRNVVKHGKGVAEYKGVRKELFWSYTASED